MEGESRAEGLAYLFPDSPNLTPKSTFLHKTLKHGKRCLRSLGRGTLGSECTSTGKFERITSKENECLSSFVPGFLAAITKSFKQATWG